MGESDKQILIVDGDRLATLISKMLSKHYGTDMAADGMKAVTKLREVSPDVIVVEVDVPGGGIKLAELVGISPKYNNIPVILMSANPTPDMIIRAKNAGASSYLAKPFKPSELQNRIDSILTAAPTAAPSPETAPDAEPDEQPAPQASEGGEGPEEAEAEPENETSTTITDRVKTIEGLPSFPATHTQILELAKSEDSTSEDLAEKIQLDPSLLATVFKLVNSTYYGFQKKVNSIQLAVTLLGLEEIANLVMAAQVFEKLGNYEDGAGLDLQAFWKHSVGTAFVARAIAKKLQTEVESAFLAGMLHDLGKIILDRYFSDFYLPVFELVQNEELPLFRAELELLGLTHAAVGGQLAQEWQFPSNYQNTILYHHTPRQAARYQRLVCLVHIANVLCKQIGYGSGGDDQVPEIDESALDRFSLGDRGMSILTEAAEEELQDADSFISALAG